MRDDQIKKFEQRGYSRGYQAGLRRRQHEVETLQRDITNSHSLKYERVYMGILTSLIVENSTWSMGETKVNDTKTYCELAKRFANEAMKHL